MTRLVARLLVTCILVTMARLGEAASVELVSRETTGYGRTENQAIANALVEAVNQVRGISVDAQNSLDSKSLDSDAKSGFREELQTQIRSRSKGLIHSYDIRSVRHEDQRWIANLLVTLPHHKGPGPDRSELRTIAVLPFRVNARVDAESGRRWEQKLITHIVQARRFRLLDREFTTELDREDNRLRSGDAPITELARIGEQLGADYVIVGDIAHLELRPGSGDLPEEASLIVEYRVLETATREVRWANTANINYARNTIQRLGLIGNRQTQEQLFNSAADAVATEILDLIYPIEVVRIEPDGSLLLTQGGNRVQIGQWFEIHATGEPTTDPQTHLSVRPDGPEVALASIVRLQEKSSWARVEQGSPKTIKKEMICRRLSAKRIAAMQQQAQLAARQEEIRRQEENIKAGKCPSLIVRAFRTATAWNLVVKNSSTKPLQINAVNKRIAGGSEQAPFSLALRGGAEEAFGLPYAFSTGDALELICNDFEQPYTFFFP